MNKKKIAIECDVGALDMSTEDGGAARIVTLYPDSNSDSGIFFRFQSWDEEFDSGRSDKPSHPEMEEFFDRGPVKVRVTLEVIK